MFILVALFRGLWLVGRILMFLLSRPRLLLAACAAVGLAWLLEPLAPLLAHVGIVPVYVLGAAGILTGGTVIYRGISDDVRAERAIRAEIAAGYVSRAGTRPGDDEDDERLLPPYREGLRDPYADRDVDGDGYR